MDGYLLWSDILLLWVGGLKKKGTSRDIGLGFLKGKTNDLDDKLRWKKKKKNG
jgi:hypothetical protein